MALLTRLLTTAFSLSSLLSTAFASPSQIDTIKRLTGRDTFEWTALGDSYSSGVGASTAGADGYISDTYRCLRYDHAYPVLIDQDKRLHEGDHKFNNVVCSGSSTEDVNNYQFYDQDMWGKPNSQFGTRPAFGNPSMATLSVGGNDIDFPGILFNCVLEWNLPAGAGPPKRSCEDQKKFSWSKIQDKMLVQNISSTIDKVVERGRKGLIGDKFKLYVTGFPQFFSVETTECDKVTFARNANPKDDGKKHIKLTQAVRKEYNDMSVQLNKAIESAVGMHKDKGVHWIPIDQTMEGHRFCEKGIKEPDQGNDKLWLYHYPYNEPENSQVTQLLQKAAAKVTLQKDQSFSDYENQIYDQLDSGDDSKQQGIQDFIWKLLGYRVKIFHPQVALHEKIRDLVLDQYVKDLGQEAQTQPPQKTTTQPPKTTTTQPPKQSQPPKKDENKCHGASGDYWVMSRDQAVDNAKDFCKKDASTAKYNQGSVNELELSVTKDGKPQKAKDSPTCALRFQMAIDGCDGNDLTNNPFNYKFGGSLEAGDGWSYKMTPLSKQVNEVSCDVSWKWYFDKIELRGKNLPNAKLGTNGEGLKKKLKHCGAMTKWKFERTPNDVKFQWYASCQLPVGTKACAGRALESAGGSGRGHCGKRSWAAAAMGIAENKRDSIEDWPGYGDEGHHVFAEDASSTMEKRDSIDDWPGYGDESRHVFAEDATD